MRGRVKKASGEVMGASNEKRGGLSQWVAKRERGCRSVVVRML